MLRPGTPDQPGHDVIHALAFSLDNPREECGRDAVHGVGCERRFVVCIEAPA